MNQPVPLKFSVQARLGQARRGLLELRHGSVCTPAFMPVGTLGPVKGLEPADLGTLGARMQLANAYHLMLRPGAERIAALGGLHQFAKIDHNILTDSGGFQVFSLAHQRKVSEEGVTFRSHLDGSPIALTPERLCAVQECLGPDIAMVLDECPAGLASRDEVAAATARTTRWAQRCLSHRRRADVAWFGIVQGGSQLDLRREHAQQMASLPCDGLAIGGVSVGEEKALIAEVVAHTAPCLPEDRPRYLMGVGTPGDLIRGVAAGVDLFDCVMPSRNARNGTLFVRGGRLSIKAARMQDDTQPIDPHCSCAVCRTHSRAFLRHLFMARELSYFRLATLHNLAFYLDLMANVREALTQQTFSAAAFLEAWAGPQDRI